MTTSELIKRNHIEVRQANWDKKEQKYDDEKTLVVLKEHPVSFCITLKEFKSFLQDELKLNIESAKQKKHSKMDYAIALVQDECVIAESNFKKTNDLNAYKDTVKNIRKHVRMKLFKNRTFDKDEFWQFAFGCGTALFAIVWIALCICFKWIEYFTLSFLFGGIPLMLFCLAAWETFNKIFPLKDEEEEND